MKMRERMLEISRMRRRIGLKIRWSEADAGLGVWRMWRRTRWGGDAWECGEQECSPYTLADDFKKTIQEERFVSEVLTQARRLGLR